jgi:hypothetical protein
MNCNPDAENTVDLCKSGPSDVLEVLEVFYVPFGEVWAQSKARR